MSYTSKFINDKLSNLILQKISSCGSLKFNECVNNNTEYKNNLISELRNEFFKYQKIEDIDKNPDDNNELLYLLNNIFSNIILSDIFKEISDKIDGSNDMKVLITNSVYKINNENKKLQDAIASYDKKIKSNTFLILSILGIVIGFLIVAAGLYINYINKKNKIEPQTVRRR